MSPITTRGGRLRPACLALTLFAFTVPFTVRAKDLDIDPSFLTIKDCPSEPGCAALVLMDETELNNEKLQARLSRRRLVKVFTAEGISEYSDIEVAAVVGDDSIRNLSGRTILPDGGIIPLKQDNIFVKTAYKQGRTRVRVKEAKFPGVVPGAIIEYSYDLIDPKVSSYTRWTWEAQEKVPVLNTKLILKPGATEFGWVQTGADKADLNHSVPFKTIQSFAMANLPSMPSEPFAPPDAAFRIRVHLYDPDEQTRWLGTLAARVGHRTGMFLDNVEGIPEKVKELTRPDDQPMAKVDKIYRFVQEEIAWEEKRLDENEKAKVKEAENAGEVLARAYGNEYERTMLFLAMVREAGLPMGLLVISSRENTLLNADVPDPSQFDTFAATVKTGDDWTFYDPASRHCPLGMIAQEKEGAAANAIIVTPRKPQFPAGPIVIHDSHAMSSYLTAAMRDWAAPVRLVKIPFSPASKNVLLRLVDATISEDGSVELEGTDQGSGQVDMTHRALYEGLDEEALRTAFAGRIHEMIPQAEVVSSEFQNLASFDTTATIHFKLKLRDAANSMGDRLILSPSLFSSSRPMVFTAQSRRTPVSLPHSQKTMERITFQIPPGYVVDQLPAQVTVRDGSLVLLTDCKEEDAGRVVFSRRVEVDPPFWSVDQYPRLKGFLEKVKDADSQVLILKKKVLS